MLDPAESVRARRATPPALFTALREAWREGYGLRELRADLAAGLTVGIVALPLSMALAIASGVPPQHGLYTAIVAGALIALLGGSRLQVSGPTAAFVVVLMPISAQYGLGGLLIATALAGVMLVILAVARLGRLIEFMPYPVTTGFTAGIAVVIAILQIRDFFGLRPEHLPENTLARFATLVSALPTARAPDLVVGAVTLAALLLWPRLRTRLPAPLFALALGALFAWALGRLFPGFRADTIATRFHYESGGSLLPGVPRLPPVPVWPPDLPGPDGRPLGLSWALLRELAPSAGAIALLGAIESLLSAVVADGMTGKRHNPDTELLAQGIGNLVAPFLGGFAATGAIARTATNVRAGGFSPFASFFHAVFLLAAILAAAPTLGLLPMASLAALLLTIAWNMSHVRHVSRLVRKGDRSDVLVLFTCIGLTVAFDMVVAVSFGVLLASLLFMRRVIALSGTTLVESGHPMLPRPVPPGVLVYRVAGPLFFGAAHKAMAVLWRVEPGIACVVLDLEAVSFLDETGLVNLESAVNRLQRSHAQVVIGGIQEQPRRMLLRAGWRGREGVRMAGSLERALDAAAEIAAATA